MENSNGKKYEGKNLMVYMKLSDMKKFEPLQSIKEFKFAPNLMYACLIPYDKLDRLKEWMNQFEPICKKQNAVMQIRSSYNRSKVLHEVK